MILEAWYKNQKLLHLTDDLFDDFHCTRLEQNTSFEGNTDSSCIISMKGCFIIYGKHCAHEIQLVNSKQNVDLAILSFQLGGLINVSEQNFEPYRVFNNDLHISFFTTKRELNFEAPPKFENFRIYLSPEKFNELLSKFYGRFSTFSENVNRSIPFSICNEALPITPAMKMVIKEVLAHKILDALLSKVYFETKITELFGLQLEQIHSLSSGSNEDAFTEMERKKIVHARNILVENLAQTITIAQLAKLVSTNENKLKRGFKIVFKKSIYNYLLVQRMVRATDLLTNTEQTIEDIAEQVGYTDSAHFSRAFKNIKGVPPGKFRKHNN